MPSEETQFKPGQSGNPTGRPKKEYCLTDILKDQGNNEDVEIEEGVMISRKQAIAQKLWSMAMSGDAMMLRYIYDRIDGSPRQSIDLESTGSVIVNVEAEGFGKL